MKPKKTQPESTKGHGFSLQNRAQAGTNATVIGLISFLTLVDLFAAQAILPMLVEEYQVSPASMGFAVNASTLGMAAAGVAVAILSRWIDRRRGIWLSLALLAVPTSLLAVAPDIQSFTLLRIAQGIFMSTAFTLTMAYLAERCSAEQAAGALAAYITGNVASNLFGRLMSASVADLFGLATTFYLFAILNLAGALLVFVSLKQTAPLADDPSQHSSLRAWGKHLSNASLRATFSIGFLILFVFIGTFTYVNFVLVREPIALGQMTLGLVYLVFLPSIFTTPLAGRAVQRFGTRPTIWCSLAIAAAGLPFLLVSYLAPVLLGLALIGIGTFFSQAAATGFISRAAASDHGAASGLYLASYYFGGLAGSLAFGQLFSRFGWTACVVGIGLSLGLAAWLASSLRVSPTEPLLPPDLSVR